MVVNDHLRILVRSALCIKFCLLIGHILLRKANRNSFWKSQNWVQRTGNILQTWRGNLLSLYGLKLIVAEGYFKFSKKGIPHAITTLFSEPMIMLSPSHIKDVFNRPEREIEVLRPQNETIEASYTLGDPELYDNAFHIKVVRNQLTRSIPHFSESIAEELQLGLDLYWGTSNEWKTVRIFEFCRNVIARAANRVFVRPVLCRDEYYLEQARQYALSVFGGALVIRLFPKFMKPVVGRLVGLKSKWHASNVEHIILPIVIDRLENAKKKQVDSEFSWVEPEDALQWIIEECLKAGDSKQLNPRLIVKRLLSLSMVSMHSTSFTIANTLIDLFSSSGYTKALEVIREEIENTLRESNGAWTKTAVVNLQHIDSTIRDSMRCSAFGIAALPRVVAHPKGIYINRYNIPKGIKLAVAMNQVHYDPLFYSNPTRFDALRFSRSLSTNSAPLTETGMEDKMRDMNDEAGNPAGSLELSAATLSDRFLSFGYGRHACPGRFFAVHEMKILLSLVLRNYDIEPLGKYPAGRHWSRSNFLLSIQPLEPADVINDE